MIPNNISKILGQLVPNIRQFQNVNTPDEFAQQLLNTGMVNQNQVNQARQMWQQPNIRQMVQNKFKF